MKQLLNLLLLLTLCVPPAFAGDAAPTKDAAHTKAAATDQGATSVGGATTEEGAASDGDDALDGTAQALDEDDEEDGDVPRKIDRASLKARPSLAAPGAALGVPGLDDSAAVPRPQSGPRSQTAGAKGKGGTEPASDDDEAEEPPFKAAGDRKVLTSAPETTLLHIDYDAVEIKEVIKHFSEQTGHNFLIDPKISGKVTIIAPRPVTKEDAYKIFLAALDSQGYTTVVEGYDRQGQPWLTRIIDAREAKTEPLGVYRNSTPNVATLITRIVQLENVSVDDVSKVISKMISSVGDLTVYNPSNTLSITDSGNNIIRLLDIIKELDISAPKQKLEVIQIEYAEAAHVVEIIREVYGEEASGTKAAVSPAASRAAARNARNSKSKTPTPETASSTSVGDSASMIGKMIADERTNSIIVLATERSLKDIKDLIAEIDYETDPEANSAIQVMYLAHAKAEELSQTLNSLIQETNQRASQNARTPAPSRGAAPTGRDAAAATTRGGTPGAAGNLGGNFQGEVRVTHDVPTNSLVVTAGADDFRRLKRVVDALDIRRKQVFVETVIMEVSDSDVKDTGVSWHGGRPGDPNNPTGVNVVAGRGTQSLNLASALLDGSLLGGIGLGIFGNAIDLSLPGVDGGIQIPMFGIVLRALQDDSSTNVLSAPNILTLDNEEATIEVGETVPFPTGGFLGGLGGATGAAGIPSISFTREDVGIILRITPQVNESDWVTLDIYQEISEVKEGSVTDSLSSGGPTTTKRSADTHVSVRSNQTIVIGGLMQEVETEAESKVPILGDLPLIGALFRNKKKTKRKTNLLIFLTPHVIDGPEDLQEVYRIKMLQREEFMRRFYGKTAQQQHDELNSLVRYSMNLPDTPSVYRDRVSKPRVVNVSGPMDESVDDELRKQLDEEDNGSLLITPDGAYEVAPGEEEEDAGDDGDDGDLESVPGDESGDEADGDEDTEPAGTP